MNHHDVQSASLAGPTTGFGTATMAHLSYHGTQNDSYYVLGFRTIGAVTGNYVEASLNDNILGAADNDYKINELNATDYYNIPQIYNIPYVLGAANPNLDWTILDGVNPASAPNTFTDQDSCVVAIKAAAVTAISGLITITTSSTSYGNENYSGGPSGVTFNVPVAGDYIIIAAAAVSKNDITANFLTKLVIDGVDHNEMTMRAITATNGYYIPFGCVRKVTLAAGTRTISFQQKIVTSGTAILAQGTILVLRADNFAAVYYGETLGAQNTGLATYQDANTLTATAQNVAHIVLSSAVVNRATTKAVLHKTIQDATDLTVGNNMSPQSNGAQMSSFCMAAVTPTAASHTWKQQFCRDATTGIPNANIKDCALLVIQPADNATVRILGGKILGLAKIL